MTQLPRPPEPLDLVVPSPLPGPARRPALVTVCGAVLLVIGVLSGVFGLTLLGAGAGSEVAGLRVGERWSAIGGASIALGGLAVVAGLMTLRLMAAGRVLGIAITAAGVVLSLPQVARGRGIVGLLLNVLVIYGLATSGDAFHTRPPGGRG